MVYAVEIIIFKKIVIHSKNLFLILIAALFSQISHLRFIQIYIKQLFRITSDLLKIPRKTLLMK